MSTEALRTARKTCSRIDIHVCSWQRGKQETCDAALLDQCACETQRVDSCHGSPLVADCMIRKSKKEAAQLRYDSRRDGAAKMRIVNFAAKGAPR